MLASFLEQADSQSCIAVSSIMLRPGGGRSGRIFSLIAEFFLKPLDSLDVSLGSPHFHLGCCAYQESERYKHKKDGIDPSEYLAITEEAVKKGGYAQKE